MNPDDFLALADELAAGTTQAAWRSAISRAYYGAFHRARMLLDVCGFTVPRFGEAHRFVAERLEHCGNRSLALAALDLAAVRTERNRADYDLAALFTDAIAIRFVMRADGAARLFAEAAGEPSIVAAITTAMAEYERTTLGVSTLRP